MRLSNSFKPFKVFFYGFAFIVNISCGSVEVSLTDFGQQDRDFLSKLEQISDGQSVYVSPDNKFGAENMKNLGFLPAGEHKYVRKSSLDRKNISLTETTTESLPEIDCIVMISIFRTKEGENYIYKTLSNMFAIFPQEMQLNILVGDSNDGYLDPSYLDNILGRDIARRIHVHKTSKEDSEFLASNLDIKRRAAWNFSRAMRNYTGTKGMLLVEDDINWSKTSLTHLAKWLNQTHPAIMSLYTRRRYLGLKNPHIGRLVQMRMVPGTPRFECTQALYIKSGMSSYLGNFLQLRLHETSYDWNIDIFLRKFRLSVGYAYPSLVQHIGRKSSGLGCFHESDCFF